MSSKTNKTLNSAMGVLDMDAIETLEFTNDGVLASGNLLGNSVYRLDSDEDYTLYIDQTHQGNIGSDLHPTMFGGLPEVVSTPSAITGNAEDDTIVVIASGVDSAGTLHCTRLKTRGE